MIDGITLLETCGGYFDAFFIFFAIISILIIIATILIYKDTHDNTSLLGFALAALFLACSILGIINNYQVTYKVLIDSSVSFIDFNNNYELVNHNNNSLIYTIKEKNSND